METGITRPMIRTWPTLALFALSAPLGAQAGGPFRIEETGQSFARLSEAVQAVGDRRATINVAPGTYGDCAVQTAGVITFRAAEPGTAIFDGGICEGKAVLVLRGRGARVDGLIFQNLRVPDGNGAGIRLEQADLEVTNSIFRNSEEGILSGPDEAGAVRIDQSTFSGLGRCDRGLSCAHSIYIGYYGSLTVTRTRFEKGRGGHYVKSNAARVSITDSSFDDSGGRTTNYMIDLPAGATGTISGNMLVQGANKENYSAMIAVAAEARNHPSSGLAITGNEALLAAGAQPTSFVMNWSGEPLRVTDNRLAPRIRPYEAR
jgi:Right handed beta helix region